MMRWLKPLLVLTALLGAFCVTFVWPRKNGLDFDIDTSPRAQAAKERAPYDLSEVRVLRAVITKINNNYVEPERIDHKRMLLAGLNAIQRQVAPVLIHHENGQSRVGVQVNEQVQEFRTDDVNSPWALTWRFKEIFAFLQKNLSQDEEVKLREVEYAAVNGMLNTLDPHSLLLTPEEYSEMQLNTRGEFGGLGIVISIRDGQLTVIRPMEGTPAFRAGLQRKDRIVKINDESTLNMPLEEAVSRLRGAPGSSVDVWVLRDGTKGWTKPKRFELVRAVIHIDSVESRMLKSEIGYVSIKNFQSNTCDDVKSALGKLHRQNMRGLVLDLRDNPGGLLQQAVCIGDLFLANGTIVTTSSNDPDKRERKQARAEGTEPSYPMIVLDNGGSASASEIVAGALKNHDRALIVGQSTFGKGSVQVLYSDDQDGWALKLTIAQYLTPGDVSIQGVGIVPDVEIQPMTVDRFDMDVVADKDYLKESDLRAHLTHATAHESGRPLHLLRYYLPAETRQRLREARPEDLEENEEEDEFLTRFSAQLLASAHRAGRRDVLRDADGVLKATAEREMKLVEGELKKFGVDWAEGPDKGPSDVQVEVSTNSPENLGIPGQPFELTVKVTNKGPAPLYRLRAVTKSDNRLFSDRELMFGKLAPGETRHWTTTLGVCTTENGKQSCKLPKTLLDRADGIRVEFSEANGHAPAAAELRSRIKALPLPQFSYTVQVADDERGNGDGEVQRGEAASIYMRITNVGKGTSEKTVANLRNLSGPGILLQRGRFQLDALAPGETKTVRFSFEALADFNETEAKLEASVGDTVLRESAGEKLVIPIRADAGPAPVAAQGARGLRDGALVRERPLADGRVVARASGVAATTQQATRGKFTRVDLGEGRPGWVATADLVPAPGRGRIVDVPAHAPPQLTVDYGDTLVTRQSELRVRGEAKDDTQIRDVYIFVGSQKVYYKSHLGAADIRAAAFDTRIPMRPGTNYVTVVAREDNEVASRTTFIVRRDGPDGALLETPKNDDEFFHPDAMEE